MIAIIPEKTAPELRCFSEALAGFLRIPLATKEVDMKGFSTSLVFNAEESRVVVSFKRFHSDTEIGPRLVVKNLIWSDRR